MSLTDEQNKALKKIKEWMNNKDQWYFKLGGYAGTGKTFLIQHLVNEEFKNAICCAPTGKAASVLKKKISVPVGTIHSLLYQPIIPQSFLLQSLVEKLLNYPDKAHKDAKLLVDAIAREKKKLAERKIGFVSKDTDAIYPGRLVIVDEASMVTKQMFEDFHNTNCKALFVGDPGQLPPVGSSNWFVDTDFDAKLNCVQRQALDSPIIRMSLDVRQDKFNRLNYQTGDCRMIRKSDMTHKDWQSADQILTGRNVSRHKINRFFRKQLGHEGTLPNAGEKLIFLKNELHKGRGIINGAQCISESATTVIGEGDAKQYFIDLLYDEELLTVEFYNYHCESNYIQSLVEEPWQERQELRELDYAYAITVHKSQGSEWDKVILADDKMQENSEEFRRRWLYTAITRAKKEFLWVD
jgi:exodeoxyribonuclease-5